VGSGSAIATAISQAFGVDQKLQEWTETIDHARECLNDVSIWLVNASLFNREGRLPIPAKKLLDEELHEKHQKVHGAAFNLREMLARLIPLPRKPRRDDGGGIPI